MLIFISAVSAVISLYILTGNMESADKVEYLNIEFFLLSIVRVIVILYCVMITVPVFLRAKSIELILFFRALIMTGSFAVIFSTGGSVFGFVYGRESSSTIINGHVFIYFIWNLISLAYIYWYFIHRIDAVSINSKLNNLASVYRITEREKDIILLISLGYSNKNISENLYISVSTTKTHIRNIFQKLKIKSRIQLVEMLKK